MILVVILLVGAYSYARVYHIGSVSSHLPGQPVKDAATGLYTVYVLVLGHRDWTAAHLDMHANIHVDSVSVYYTSPALQPSGYRWGGFGKRIAVTLQITGGSLSSPVVSTFALQSVALGASWGQVVTFSLPSGSYTVTSVGMDQGGYQSSASATLTLQ